MDPEHKTYPTQYLLFCLAGHGKEAVVLIDVAPEQPRALCRIKAPGSGDPEVRSRCYRSEFSG